MKRSPSRLDSLDMLRGLDMLILVIIHPIIMALSGALPDNPVVKWLAYQSSHVEWEGLTVHDLIMPLFMFTAGVAIPLSMAKFRTSDTRRFEFDRPLMYKRIARRVALLWIIGMVMQGNLLGFNPHAIYIFTNTLQAIAIGFLFTTIIYTTMRPVWQIVTCIAMMVVYTLVMQFGHATGWGIEYGMGSYTPQSNMAEYIDRVALGPLREGATRTADGCNFLPDYLYTWILSSLTFIVTVCSGMFAGEILLKGKSSKVVLRNLAIYGVALLVAAWALSYSIPVIKKIWTPSMVLLSSGWSVVLLAILYYIADMRGLKRWAFPLKILGMNAIAAYVLGEYFNFSSLTTRLFYGFAEWDLYSVVIATANSLLIFAIVWAMYRCGKFIKL